MERTKPLTPEFQQCLSAFEEALADFTSSLPEAVAKASGTPHVAALLMLAFAKVGADLHATLYPLISEWFLAFHNAALGAEDPDAVGLAHHLLETFTPLERNPYTGFCQIWTTIVAILGFIDRVSPEEARSAIVLPSDLHFTGAPAHA